ncbi:Gypsy retrotransposon integrase-like protein 1, partial [Mucuna pruriens]
MGHMKAQVLAHFVNKLTPNSLEEEEARGNKEWTLSIDGSSNKKGSGVGIILKGPGEALIEQSLWFGFQTSNNQAEYEALLAGIWLTKEFGARRLIIETFEGFTLLHIPREQNERADLVDKLASTQKGGLHRTVIQEALGRPTIEEIKEAQRINREVTKYILIAGQLYIRGFSLTLLQCLGEIEVERAIKEVHKGACGSHIGGKALASNITRARFYWLVIKKDSLVFVKKCDKCQRYADQHQVPPKQLHLITSPWPFYIWGVDILGPFPMAVGQVKFLLVAVDYFTKWIEVESVVTISTERVRHFYWRRIACHFGLLTIIVSDNSTQFASREMVELYAQYGIKQSFTSVKHPQSNGQAEAVNRVILRGLRKRLEEAKGRWETPFHLTFGTDAMISVEVEESKPRDVFTQCKGNEQEMRTNLDLL